MRVLVVSVCLAWLAWTHAYQPKSDLLEVFIVPHSHCDVGKIACFRDRCQSHSLVRRTLPGWSLKRAGWLETVQSYYDTSVKSILDTMVDSLSNNPDQRFIWAEIKWFSMWWPVQTPAVQVCSLPFLTVPCLIQSFCFVLAFYKKKFIDFPTQSMQSLKLLLLQTNDHHAIRL